MSRPSTAPRWVWWTARGTAFAARGAPTSGPARAGTSAPSAGCCTASTATTPARSGPASPAWRRPTGPRASSPCSTCRRGDATDAVRADGHLSREWLRGHGRETSHGTRRWAELALDLQQRQATAVRGRCPTVARHPDRRRCRTSSRSRSRWRRCCASSSRSTACRSTAPMLDALLVRHRRARARAARPRRSPPAVRATSRVWSAFPGEPVDLRNPAARPRPAGTHRRSTCRTPARGGSSRTPTSSPASRGAAALAQGRAHRDDVRLALGRARHRRRRPAARRLGSGRGRRVA